MAGGFTGRFTRHDEEGLDWSASTARAAASNLLAVARPLEQNPVPPPPSE